MPIRDAASLATSLMMEQVGLKSEPGELKRRGTEAHFSLDVSVTGDYIYLYCLSQCEFKCCYLQSNAQ